MPPPSPQGWVHGVFRKNISQGFNTRRSEQMLKPNTTDEIVPVYIDWPSAKG
jgi:hypothetical protein